MQFLFWMGHVYCILYHSDIINEVRFHNDIAMVSLVRQTLRNLWYHGDSIIKSCPDWDGYYWNLNSVLKLQKYLRSSFLKMQQNLVWMHVKCNLFIYLLIYRVGWMFQIQHFWEWTEIRCICSSSFIDFLFKTLFKTLPGPLEYFSPLQQCSLPCISRVWM